MVNLLKDRKAVSPVIAVLLMVAIAVVAALITYSWVTGFVTTTTVKAGRAIQVQACNGTYVWVQNVGQSTVNVTAVFVEGSLTNSTVNVQLSPGQIEEIKIGTAVSSGETIRVVCADGTFTEYTYYE